MKPYSIIVLCALLLSCSDAGAQGNALKYPKARIDTIADSYFGQVVQDPYRWLESDTLFATQAWLAEETQCSDSYLKKIRNKYAPEAQLKLNSYYTFGTINKSGSYYFDLARENSYSRPCLYIKKARNDEGRKIIDPENYKDARRDKVSIRDYKVSDDDKYIAFSLSSNGSDWREIRVMSLYPFHDQEDVIKGVKFSEIEWFQNGFFYMRYPMTGNVLQDKTINPAICYHSLGTAQDRDRVVYEDTKFSESNLSFQKVSGGDENYLIINHGNGENFKVLAVNLRGDMPSWKTDTILISNQKAKFDVVGLFNDKFLAKTTLFAPNGRLVLFDKNKKNAATELVPQHVEVLHKASIVGNKIVCIYLKDIDYLAFVFNKDGAAVDEIRFPPGSSVEGFDGDTRSSSTVYYQYSFLYPPIAYQYDVNAQQSTLVKKTEIPYDINEFETEKVYYYSKDSTKIPMVLAHKKGIKKDGKNPTLLYGYGGYGMVTTPFYERGFISFMQNGGTVAIPSLRGGGEYGEKWHEDGNLLNKENVFDDFIGAAEFLFKEGYTSKDMLSIMGGSNGGLLVAAVLNKRPDICKVAIAMNGIYDMLRYQEYTIGSAWKNEFGSSKNATQFPNLYHYSPLHNIKDTAYPAILVVTADHDDRVVPMHSYKYVAALQQKNKSENPVLLLVQKNKGHEGLDLELDANIYSFIYDQLEIPLRNIHNFRY